MILDNVFLAQYLFLLVNVFLLRVSGVIMGALVLNGVMKLIVVTYLKYHHGLH